MKGGKILIHAQIYLLFTLFLLQCIIFMLTFQIFKIAKKHKITINSMFFIFTFFAESAIV